MPDLFRATSARFSECRTYRYELRRTWGDGPLVNFICLNPSTADEEKNDATVERLERRAQQLGLSGLIVTNLFGFRATAPAVMLAVEDPVGPGNDAAILAAAKEAGLVVCAWGAHGAHRGRSAEVRKLLAEAGVALHALKLTQGGEPQHPLYLAYNLQPTLWKGGE